MLNVQAYVEGSRSGWNWDKFVGSAEALKYNRRDLPNVAKVLEFVPGRTAVVQAGGNLGIFPKFLADNFKVVYTFEPASELIAVMAQNAPERNIVRLQAALGKERKLVGTSRSRRDGKPNIHEGITHIVEGGRIPTLLIDDLALPVCDLIYLDVEGYELFALQGAVQTLKRCRPVIACEINKSIKYVGFSKEDVHRFIQDCGYNHVASYGSDNVFISQ